MGEVSAGDEIAGRYRLVKLLGSGGQGEVWEATSLTVTTLRVALKRVRHEGDGAERAVEEAEKLARVRHAHVVAVHDVVTEGDDHWIVMGYVAGIPLRRLGRITVEQAATYGAQLADGLAAVHAQGLLHRDVTPSNVLVADDVATLVDFGIADSVSDAVTVTGTETGTSDADTADTADDADARPALGPGGARVSGTPGYLAPEMLVPGTQYRRPADVFGLGATLYWALEGVTPFEDSGPTSPAAGAERRTVRTPRRSGAMSDVVVRMLHKNPRERPALEDVRDELRSIAAGESQSTTPAPPRKARNAGAFAAVASVVALVVAGALYSWNAYGPPPGGEEQAAGPARAGLRAESQPEPSPKETAEKAPDAEPSAGVVADPAPSPSPSNKENEAGGATEPETETAAAPIQFPRKSGDAAREASWDPCELLGAGSLDRFGTARIDSDRAEFQTCDATVSNGSGVSEVELTMFVDEDPDGSGSDQGDVTLYSAEGDGECSREVVFGADDRYNLSFEAHQVEGSGADLCAMAQSVADRTASLAAADDLPVRTALPMPGSAIGGGTCDLPSDSVLRTALDIDDLVSPQREFAEWDCKWDGDEGRYLRLLFERNEGYAPDGGARTSLSGHPAYERGDAWGEGCLVDVVAGEGPSPEGDGRVTELLRVHLTGESDQDTLCEDAVTVARSAAAAL